MADMLLYANKYMNADITVYAMDLNAERLGWKGQFTVEEGIRHTLDIMRELD